MGFHLIISENILLELSALVSVAGYQLIGSFRLGAVALFSIKLITIK
jgi:hypothetical protein